MFVVPVGMILIRNIVVILQVSRVPKVCEKNLNDDEIVEDELSDVWWNENEEEEEQEPDLQSQPAYHSEDVESIEAGYISEPCTTYQSKYTFSSEDEVSIDKDNAENNRKRKNTLSEINRNCEYTTEMQEISEKTSVVRFGLLESSCDNNSEESRDMTLSSD